MISASFVAENRHFVEFLRLLGYKITQKDVKVLQSFATESIPSPRSRFCDAATQSLGGDYGTGF